MRESGIGKTAIEVTCLLLLGATARGQILTGNVIGTTKDASGAFLSGAKVTIQSSALLGASSSKATDGRGQFRFPALAPGVYRLEVELSGFKGYREENLQVLVGGSVERNVVLELAAVAETVSVSAAGPAVDARKAGLSTNYTWEQVENTPVRRLSVFDLMKSAPGMSATSPSGRNLDVSAFGSGVNENAYLMDGTNYTSPTSGLPFSQLDTDVLQEIEIVSLGASAEYGNFQGAVFNAVTRQGESYWRADSSYYHMSQSLTSQPLLLDCNCPKGESGYTVDQYRDFTGHLGGPVLRDRLWVFAGYQYQRDYNTQPGADPRFPAKWETDRVFGKLTWQAKPSLKLTHTFHDDYWEIPGSPSPAFPIETLVTFGGHAVSATFANLTQVLNDSTLWDARVSGSIAPNVFTRPNSKSLPFRFDLASGTASGGSCCFGSRKHRRLEVAGKLTHFADRFLGASHDFKFGVQWVNGYHRDFHGYPGGALYYDYAGQPYLAYFREPYSSAGEFRNWGLFAEDAVRLGDRLTVNLGLRFDRTRAASPSVPAIDGEGNETGGRIPGLGTFYTWNVASPRLGFNWKLSSEGRTVLRGSWGRYYAGVITGEFDFLHPGLTPITIAYYDPLTAGYTEVIAVIDDARDVRIDPDTKSPHTDEFSFGLDRELGRNLALGATFIKKDGRNSTGWEDIGGIYGEEMVTLADGRVLRVFPLLNSTSERLYLMTNPEGWFLDYKGLLLTLSKRWSGRWQALVSYSVSEAVGLLASSGRGAGGSQVSSAAFGVFGRDPNDLTNATGNLPNDRTHMLRVQAAVEVPKVGVLVGANFQQLSGKPWAGIAQVRLPQGSRAIYVETRGAQNLPSQALLDLRVSKIFRFGKQRKLELLVDVLNVLNETAPENVVSRNVFSPNFGEGSSFVEPRRAMLGIKFVF